MDDIVARIIKRMGEIGYDQKTFAAEIGVSPATITDWKTGKSQSYMKKINIISAALSTPLAWLVFGEGPKSKIDQAWQDGTLPGSPKYPARKQLDVSTTASELDTISPEEQRLLMAYRIADARTKEMVRLALEPFGLSAPSDEAM